MNKLTFAAILALLFSVPVGCEKESSVAEAPPVSEDASMDGMTEDEYNDAMEEALNQQ
ncbi:hypothetical protein [Rhodopirellula sp. P2]|uniref:hypothetical protein n=1 Tax=Rhodopirellula sp. P2 TaxID=2127060 RepID=UPI002368412A|nr:hypothetical protein [Rhodopirellula sp. P2]WDQ18424.1 hypothetical protein PSR62_07735 [Rhodopirellula sp. P2]